MSKEIENETSEKFNPEESKIYPNPFEEGFEDGDCLTRVCPQCGNLAEIPDCSCGYMF